MQMPQDKYRGGFTMEYIELDSNEARECQEFLKPGLTDDPNFDGFLFTAAFDDSEGVTGMIAVDPRLTGPEIKSIGVSSAHTRQRIGFMLYEKMYEGLQFRYDPVLEEEPMPILIKDCMREEEWKKLEGFLDFLDFHLMERNKLYKTVVGEFLEREIVKKALSKKITGEIVPLAEAEDMYLRIINNSLVKRNIYPPIKLEDYDGQTSLFYVEDDGAISCVLNTRTGEKEYENEWMAVYGAHDGGMLLRLMAETAKRCAQEASPDATMTILAANEDGIKIREKLFPNAEDLAEVRTYSAMLLRPGEFYSWD